MMKKIVVLGLVFLLLWISAPVQAIDVTFEPSPLEFTVCYDSKQPVDGTFYIKNNGNNEISYDLFMNVDAWYYVNGHDVFGGDIPAGLDTMYMVDFCNRDPMDPLVDPIREVGTYEDAIYVTVSDKVTGETQSLSFPVIEHVIDCTPAPEFPVTPGLSTPFVTIGLVGAMLSIVLLVRMNPRK